MTMVTTTAAAITNNQNIRILHKWANQHGKTNYDQFLRHFNIWKCFANLKEKKIT